MVKKIDAPTPMHEFAALERFVQMLPDNGVLAQHVFKPHFMEWLKAHLRAGGESIDLLTRFRKLMDSYQILSGQFNAAQSRMGGLELTIARISEEKRAMMIENMRLRDDLILRDGRIADLMEKLGEVENDGVGNTGEEVSG